MAQKVMAGGTGGYIVTKYFNGHPSETYYGDTDNVDTMVNVIRINKNGIAFSNSGISGPYVSAWTIDGKFNADFIQAGKISGSFIEANSITVGKLSDEVQNKINNNIHEVHIEYAKSNSNSDPPIEGWDINPPDVGDNEYLWQRTTTIKADGSTESTEAICITGIKGADATIIYIDSTDGNVFKNNAVATELKVTVQIGNISITGIDRLKAVYGHSAFLQWSYKGLKGEKVILSQDDPKISNDGFTLTIGSKDIDVKGTFTCDLIIEELTKNGN